MNTQERTTFCKDLEDLRTKYRAELEKEDRKLKEKMLFSEALKNFVDETVQAKDFLLWRFK